MFPKRIRSFETSNSPEELAVMIYGKFENGSILRLVSKVENGKFKLIKRKNYNPFSETMAPKVMVMFGEICGEICENKITFVVRMSAFKELIIWIDIVVLSIVVIYGVYSEVYDILIIVLFLILALIFAYSKTREEVELLEQLLINEVEDLWEI